jgi:hypothetical protein
MRRGGIDDSADIFNCGIMKNVDATGARIDHNVRRVRAGVAPIRRRY